MVRTTVGGNRKSKGQFLKSGKSAGLQRTGGGVVRVTHDQAHLGKVLATVLPLAVIPGSQEAKWARAREVVVGLKQGRVPPSPPSSQSA